MIDKYQYPSTTVKRKFIGDENIASMYIGEGNKLLYQLKNLMRLSARSNFRKLKQWQMTRLSDNGAIISAKSVFGNDIIEINVEGILNPSCRITLLNIPESIQPMKWYMDGIQVGEVEGVDYIKTYYTFIVSDCPDCSKWDMSVCDTNELGQDTGFTTGGTQCVPFRFVSQDSDGNPTLLYQGGSVLYNDTPPIDVNNHQIYSTYNHCQAEIISFGHDDGGAYFLWKAYTEWSNLGPYGVEFTQSGLGYMLLRAFINQGGKELCHSDSSIIKVDCCLKTLENRTPQIYWENCIGGGWCVAPTSNSIEVDLEYFWQLGGWISMLLWMQGGACIPATWNVTGIGTMTDADASGMISNYKVAYSELTDLLAAAGCEGTVSISIEGTDRCGTKDTIIFTNTPCCDDASPVEIGYTLLQMSCGGSQTFTASGGCAPYVWSKSGGGTLTPSEDTTQAGYVAPATNAGCANNPTISLSDCCGSSDSIKLAVNCTTPDATAYDLIGAYWISANCGNHDCEWCGYIAGCRADPQYQQYKCDGTLRVDWISGDPCSGSPTCSSAVIQYLHSVPCTCPADPCTYYAATGKCCPGGYPGCVPSDGSRAHPCEYTCDIRNADMKAAGCCPINPYTGLPF